MSRARARGDAGTVKRRQDLLLDGIEVSLFSGHVAYQRLWTEVLAYSETDLEDREKIDMLRHMLLVDAWSFVDVVHRLRACVCHAPGLKKNAPVKSLLKTTEEIVELRNFVQHLDSEAPKLASTAMPIWGSLSWTWANEESAARGEIASMIAISGRLAAPASFPMVNPAGKKVKLPVDMISLTAGGVSVNLSDVYENVYRFDLRYRKALEVAKGKAPNTNDILSIVLEHDEGKEPPSQSTAPDA